MDDDYKVIDIKATLFVTREEYSFRVINLCSGKTVSIPSVQLRAVTLKYTNEFVAAFRKGFAAEESKYVYLSKEADKYLSEILYFNRIEF